MPKERKIKKHVGDAKPDKLIEKLESLNASSEARAIWRNLALTEGRKSPDEETPAEERLAIYRIYRDAGAFPREVTFFLITGVIQEIASKRIQVAITAGPLKEISDRIERIEKSERLGDEECWPAGEEPAEYQALCAEWDRIADRITVATFREYGEVEMADLYEHSPLDFRRRRDIGRQYIFGQKIFS